METAIKQRHKALVGLQEQLERYSSMPNISESVLEVLCEGVDAVRNGSVAVAEAIVTMKMHCSKYSKE